MGDPFAHPPVRIAVLCSGASRGSNLQALLNASENGQIPAKVALLIATRSDAPAVDKAKLAGASVKIVSPKKYTDQHDDYALALLNNLQRHAVDIVCLLGYMRRLPPSVVKAYSGRVINIHPALLPQFGGQGMYGENVHKAVLECKSAESGCTVHLVDEEYDTGPILVQHKVPVLETDTPASLAARVLAVEHTALIEAVKMLCRSLINLSDSEEN